MHAKAAFTSSPLYNLNQALSISQQDLAANGWNHGLMTAAQRTAFASLWRSIGAGTGRNTMLIHDQIAVDALVAGGVPLAGARSLVAQSLWNLRTQGVTAPTDVPWGGACPGTFR